MLHAFVAYGSALSFSLRGADVAMRGGAGMTACGRGIAQRWTEGNALGQAQEAIDGIAAALQLETEHVAETVRQQAFGQLVIGMLRPAGIDHARDARLLG